MKISQKLIVIIQFYKTKLKQEKLIFSKLYISEKKNWSEFQNYFFRTTDKLLNQ